MTATTLTTSSGNKVQDLLQSNSEKVKKEISIVSTETGLAYLAELFRGNGWLVSYADKSDTLLLSDSNHPRTIVLMVKFFIQKGKLTDEEAHRALMDFENHLSPQYGCSQFAIIAVNGIEKKAEKLEQFNLLLQDWTYIDDLIANYHTRNTGEPRIQFFAHNKQTYTKVCKMMKHTDSVAVVQATGTGKSFLIAKLVQDFEGRKRLVMAPSLYVIDQIRQHIRSDTGNIEFMTYARSMNLSQSEIRALNLDMIVLDEFHRRGAEEWGRGVSNILGAYPSSFKFGTSATPVRYMDNARDMSQELFKGNVAENLSLAQAIVRNILPMPKYVCAVYTLGEETASLKTKIYASRVKEEVKEKMLLDLDAVAIDWERSHGIPAILNRHLGENKTKFIVFCKDEEHLFEMEPAVTAWFREATCGKEVKTYRIFDGEPDSDQNLADFKSAGAGTSVHLLLSINMLNEGLHVAEVSGVVLLRPTESPNIFYQQIGRCLKAGLNYIPVIFDLVNNFRSIRTNDFLHDLEWAHSQFAAQRAAENLEDRCPTFTVIDEVREITELFGEIKFRLDDWETMFQRLADYKEEFGNCHVPATDGKHRTLWNWLHNQRRKFEKGLLEPERRDKLITLGVEWKLNQLLGSRIEGWEKHYKELRAFRETYGHCNVSDKKGEFRHLAGFVKDQRYRYGIGTLEQDRIDRLLAIGFEFKRAYHEGRWQLHFDELVAYKAEHGHLKMSFQTHTPLLLWMNNQRRDFRNNKLDAVRQEKLNSIGFEWKEDEEALFEKNLSKLVAWYEEHKHFTFPQNSEMHRFAISIRTKYKHRTLSDDAIQQLQAIGFTLQFKENAKTKRRKRLEQLEHFFELNGHGNVTKATEKDEGLAEWLVTQRKHYTKGLLSKEIIQKMESLGVTWNFLKGENDKRWNWQYAKLLAHYRQTGTTILANNKSDLSLQHWCSNQRAKYKEGKLLTVEQVERLNAVGFKWEVLEAQWEEQFAALTAFKEQYGHCRVYQKRPEAKALSVWCSNTRKAYKNGTLPAEKIKRLESLGFIWNIQDCIWYTKYESLAKHLETFTWEELIARDKLLNDWVGHQRKNHRQKKLTEEKVMLLNRLLIDWEPFANNWSTMFGEFLKYKEQQGTARVSYADKSIRSLWNWCVTQRDNYRNDKLPADKLKLLNGAGFEWELQKAMNKTENK